MKSIKELLLGTLRNGPEVLNDIKVCRRNGKDIVTEIGRVGNKISEYHPKSLKLEVSEIIDVTADAKTFRLTSENGWLPPFMAGQFINVFTEIDGVRTSRPYSLSSSPAQRGYYEITVARIPTGFVSDYFLNTVKVGDKLEANGPAGHFHFNPVFHRKKSVYLAGGSGITPFVSMTRDVLESGKDREIYLIYGTRTEKAALFYEELKEKAAAYPNFHFELIVSDDPSFNGRKGFIDAACIGEIVGKTDDADFYICGPQVMNDFCVRELEKMGIDRKHVHREVFGARQDIENEPGWPSELTGKEVFTLTVDGKKYPARSNESILTALERAGIKAPVCCRSGGCGMCRVKLLSGRVFTARGVLVRHADEKFGYIHSCKSYPISDVEILL